MNHIALSIRSAEASDCQVVYECICLLEECEFNFELFQNAYLKNLDLEDSIYLLAETEGVVVGYLSCHTQRLLHHGGEKVGEIQELFVQAVFRNMGIGRLLIAHLKKEARARQITQIEVCSNKKRSATHRFYLREKFENTHEKFVLFLE